MTLKDFSTALFAILLIGSNLILLKIVDRCCSVDVFNTLRFSMFLLIIPFLKFPKQNLKWILFYSLFNCFLNFTFIALAISTDIQGSFLSISSLPRIIGITFLSYLIIKESISLYQFFGLLIGCLSLYIFQIGIAKPEDYLGILYIICSGLSWAIAFTMIKKYHLKFSLSDICYANAFAAPMMFVYTISTQGITSFTQLDLNVEFLGMLAYSSLCPILFATYLWQRLLLKYNSIQLNPIMNLLPFVVYFEAILFLNEAMNLHFIFLLMAMFFSLLMCQNINIFKRLKFKRLN